MDTIRKLHGEAYIDDEVRFILQLYFSGVTRMTIGWLMDEHTSVKPEEMTERLMHAMPEKIRKLLF